MKAVVIGGSGATGKELVNDLLQDASFTNVVVLLRKNMPITHPKLVQVIVQFDRLQDYATQIYGDVAFSCLGTTRNAAGSKEEQWKVDHDYQLCFASIARENGIPVFVLLSAANVSKSSSFFYNRMKGTLEENIRALHFQKLLIFRPGMIIRPHSDRIGERIGLSVLKFLNRLKIFLRYEPLHTSLIAKAMVRAVKIDNPPTIFNIGDMKSLGQ